MTIANPVTTENAFTVLFIVKFYDGDSLKIRLAIGKASIFSHKNDASAHNTIMLNLFLRCLILYFFLLLAMRLMGKRQLGELQPFELAITLVASELVCIPMADATIPIIYGIIPVFSLFLVHIIITKLATKSVRFRKFLNGKPVILIRDGNILPDVMKELNMNIDDIMEALRGSGYFNPEEVEYAILETNGSLTVMPKAQYKPICAQDVGVSLPKANIPVTVIMEGEFLGDNLAKLEGVTKERMLTFLDRLDIKQSQVLVLLVAGQNVFLQPYHGNFITAQLSCDEDAELNVSICDASMPDSASSPEGGEYVRDENMPAEDIPHKTSGESLRDAAIPTPNSAQSDGDFDDDDPSSRKQNKGKDGDDR